MKRLILLTAILSSSAVFSQKYFSKVMLAGDQFITTETHIEVLDGEIKMVSEQYNISYQVLGTIGEGYFKIETGNEPMAIFIQPIPGKAKKFKYTHTITLAPESNIGTAGITYYAVIEE